MSDMGPRESLWPDAVAGYDLTLATPAQNLAFDEALLIAVDLDPTVPCIRFWQPTEYFVVLGRSNNVDTEVDVDRCRAEGIPILRRSSGGGTVIVGPGCLCYSLVLPNTDLHRALGVSKVTAELMARTASGFKASRPDIDVCGTSDLVYDGWKFSGNAQRWLRKAFIHHGTLLYDFDLQLLERFLRHPTREPDYRQSRRHSDFVANLPLSSTDLKASLSRTWNAVPTNCPAEYLDKTNEIVTSRYRDSEWQIAP
jgi:lipoate-protein ligase A